MEPNVGCRRFSELSSSVSSPLSVHHTGQKHTWLILAQKTKRMGTRTDKQAYPKETEKPVPLGVLHYQYTGLRLNWCIPSVTVCCSVAGRSSEKFSKKQPMRNSCADGVRASNQHRRAKTTTGQFVRASLSFLVSEVKG